jgi:hypothetical protein
MLVWPVQDSAIVKFATLPLTNWLPSLVGARLLVVPFERKVDCTYQFGTQISKLLVPDLLLSGSDQTSPQTDSIVVRAHVYLDVEPTVSISCQIAD